MVISFMFFFFLNYFIKILNLYFAYKMQECNGDNNNHNHNNKIIHHTTTKDMKKNILLQHHTTAKKLETRNENGHSDDYFISIKRELSSTSITPISTTPTKSTISLLSSSLSNSSTTTSATGLSLTATTTKTTTESTTSNITKTTLIATPTTITTGTATTITTTTTTTATTAILGFPSYSLLQWRDMPKHLQFNPYIHTGYRPLQDVKGCMFSLFHWHNETINILSHGIPIVYILATVPAIMPWEKDFRFLSFCHLFGSLAPWCGSFIYHLFMNLENGQNIYYRLLKIDMLGIWVSQSFGALPMVTATMFCFSFKWKFSIILSYCLLSLWGLYKALTASSPWQRRLCFLLPFLMRIVLIFLRTIRWVGGNPEGLTHVYLQDGVSVFGATIGAMHIPEKWFPGCVDLYFNSHNIMHILVVVAVYSMHQATISDFEWMSKTQCNIVNNSSDTIDMTAIDSHTEL